LKDEGFSTRQIAKSLGTSHTTIQNDLNDGKNLPDGKIKVLSNKELKNGNGKNLPENILNRDPEDIMKSEEKRIKKSDREKSKNEKQELNRTEAIQKITHIENEILIGDFRLLADKIPDNSISLILTDPPYDKGGEKLFDDLSEFATSKLIEGGSFLCYMGHTKLSIAMEAFNKNLRYWWIIACLHSGGSSVMREYGIRALWKPILWYVKNTRYLNQSMLQDTVSGGREKSDHPWQQSVNEAEYLIEKLCPEDGIVLDPFLGSGTVAIAAKRLKRKWIGIEIDSGTAIIAQKRIEENDKNI